MNESVSANIETTFSNCLSIYGETAILLKDARMLMEESGYRCLQTTHAIATHQSKDIKSPERWLTPFAALYFESEDDATQIKGLGVHFVDADFRPTRPLIITGCFKMQTDEDDKTLPYFYWCLSDAWFNGSSREVGKELKIEGRRNYTRAKIRSVPLEEVTDVDHLREKVVEPLAQMSP